MPNEQIGKQSKIGEMQYIEIDVLDPFEPQLLVGSPSGLLDLVFTAQWVTRIALQLCGGAFIIETSKSQIVLLLILGFTVSSSGLVWWRLLC